MSRALRRLQRRGPPVAAKECVRGGDPIQSLDSVAMDLHLRQQSPEGWTALEVVLNVHWLQRHGHLARDQGVMVLWFSRATPQELGKRIAGASWTPPAPRNGHLQRQASARRRGSWTRKTACASGF